MNDSSSLLFAAMASSNSVRSSSVTSSVASASVGQRREMHAGDEVAGIGTAHRDARVLRERANLRKAAAELRKESDHRTADQRWRAATEQSQCSVVRGGDDTAARQQQRGHRVQIEQFTRAARIGARPVRIFSTRVVMFCVPAQGIGIPARVWIAPRENFVRGRAIPAPAGFRRGFPGRYVMRVGTSGKYAPFLKELAIDADMTTCGVVPGCARHLGG